MTARQVIDEIKRLEGADRAEVEAFVQAEIALRESSSAAAPASGVQYLDAERAREISQRIFRDNAELFRKLAQ